MWAGVWSGPWSTPWFGGTAGAVGVAEWFVDSVFAVAESLQAFKVLPVSGTSVVSVSFQATPIDGVFRPFSTHSLPIRTVLGQNDAIAVREVVEIARAVSTFLLLSAKLSTAQVIARTQVEEVTAHEEHL